MRMYMYIHTSQDLELEVEEVTTIVGPLHHKEDEYFTCRTCKSPKSFFSALLIHVCMRAGKLGKERSTVWVTACGIGYLYM